MCYCHIPCCKPRRDQGALHAIMATKRMHYSNTPLKAMPHLERNLLSLHRGIAGLGKIIEGCCLELVARFHKDICLQALLVPFSCKFHLAPCSYDCVAEAATEFSLYTNATIATVGCACNQDALRTAQ